MTLMTRTPTPVFTSAPPMRPVHESVNDAGRPLLSRVAENIFWSARYVERAEHVARAAWVTNDIAFDAGDLSDALRDRLWTGLLEALDIPVPEGATPGMAGSPCMENLVFEPISGINAAVARARENARAVRGEISAEMWRTLNERYWEIIGDSGGARRMLNESAEGFFDHVINGSMLFQGVTDQTLAHGQRWDFALVGRLLERADATCRIIMARSRFLEEAGGRLETPLRNIQLMAALRMCCSVEAYRQQHPRELDLRQVVAFVLLRAEHPRSVRFSVQAAHRAVQRIRMSSGGRDDSGAADPAERLLGRLAARLEYAEASDVAADGVGAFVADVRGTVAAVNAALQRRYFQG